jgi:hypothetical protein
MKKWEAITIVVLIVTLTVGFSILAYKNRVSVGRQEQGEWIKVVDTTYHWEFKTK